MYNVPSSEFASKSIHYISFLGDKIDFLSISYPNFECFTMNYAILISSDLKFFRMHRIIFVKM